MSGPRSLFIFLIFAGCSHFGHSAADVLIATSLYRFDYMLNVSAIKTVTNLSVSKCLMICRNTVECQSFNYGKGTCFILDDFLCSRASNYKLTPAHGMRYFDLLQSPDDEIPGILGSSNCTMNGRCDKRCACVTKDTGQMCILPFVLFSTGKVYYKCTKDSEYNMMVEEKEPWCSTKVNEIGYHMVGFSGPCADWC